MNNRKFNNKSKDIKTVRRMIHRKIRKTILQTLKDRNKQDTQPVNTPPVETVENSVETPTEVETVTKE